MTSTAALERVTLKPVGEEAASNFERYSNPEADAVLQEYKLAIDPTTQKQLGYQLQNVVYNDLPVLSLYYGGSWGLMNDAKFTGWPSAENPYASPEDLRIHSPARAHPSEEGQR